MASVTVIEHPLVQHKLTQMRRKETPMADFRRYLREISLLMAYELLRDLELGREPIETPVGPMNAPVLSPDPKLCFVSVLRAGNGILEGMLDLLPSVPVGFIGLFRDPRTLEAVEYFFKMPFDVTERLVIVFDPMLATGHSAVAAVRRLKAAGVTKLRYVCLLSAPEGVAHFTESHPDVPVFTAAIDDKLNDHGYIIPGLGDAGDRLYGTK
jgi:uracil phosphoribosyltransferase